MNRIKIMINGMPGNVASSLAIHAMKDERFEIINASLTGPEITRDRHIVAGKTFSLIHPDQRDQAIAQIKNRKKDFIAVDFTHPTAVNGNAEFYCRNGLYFVMGTTGGDRHQLEQTVVGSGISAVIAPNMAKQIVGFQAMMRYAAENFPGLFSGYRLEIRESHQKGKADTSGTARAMVAYFNKMGVAFTEDQIIKERDPGIQKSVWKIPEAYLSGHAWHTYTLNSEDGTVTFSFTHNINGRDVYAQGTFDAVEFLFQKAKIGQKGRVYTMIDVLRQA